MTLNTTTISIIRRLLGGRNNKPLKAILKRVEIQDLARLFAIFNDRETRLFVDALMSIDRASQALTELPPPQLVTILNVIETPKLLTLLSYCPEDDATYVLSQLEDDRQNEILARLEPHRQIRLRQLLSYPSGSAGRDMFTEVFALPQNMTAQQAIDRIRSKRDEESIYYIYCVNEDNILSGVVSLRELVKAKPDTPLFDIMKKDVISVHPEATSDEVARLVSHYDYIALPVVKENGELMGLITVDNVVDILQEQASASMYASAGLQEDDRVYSPPGLSIKYRLPWILLNLGTAVTSSTVVAQFEHTMSEVIVLASLNSIVSGIGGNTGIQTATVMTRGFSTGDFDYISFKKAYLKELAVAAFNGTLVGLVGGAVVYLWKHQLGVAFVMAGAMVLNSLVAATMGSFVPWLLKKRGLDPATGSSVVVTFATDTCGFFFFLGIATLALKYFGSLS